MADEQIKNKCRCGGSVGWLRAENGGLVRCECNPAPVITPKATVNAGHPARRSPSQVGYNSRDPHNKAKKFVLFHHANPTVWAEIKRMALGEIAKGLSHISIYDIYEDLRKGKVKTTGATYKLDNDFAAPYAHLFRFEFPQYADMLELRRSEIAARALAMLKEMEK